MLAIDLSGSMRERDMVINRQTLNRLQTVQRLATEFIKKALFALNVVTYLNTKYLTSFCPCKISLYH